MRIAFVHDFHAERTPSGENVVVDAETAALRRAGHDVRVLSVRNDEMARSRLHAVRGAATVATGLGLSPLAQLGDFRPDVIHVHNLFPYFGTRWIDRAPAPVVTTLHNFRSMCANGYLFRDGHVCTRCPDGRPWSGVRYGCYRDSAVATLPLAVATWRGAARDPLLRRSARVLALSDRSMRLFAAAGVPAGKLERAWHFVPDALAGAGAATVAPDAPWLFVGRLSPEKGIDRLVERWPADRPLQVIGDGELRDELERGASAKRVTFLGAQPREVVMDAMAAACGVVFPSVWYETFGLVYIEALSVGTPTLAFPPNVVADAVTVDGTGSRAEWDAVPAAVAAAAGRFPAMRARCRAVFEERYAEAAFVTRRIDLYERVVAEAGQGRGT